MDKYQVIAKGDKYLIKATHWSVGDDGLKFYQGEKIVAWFNTWDNWGIYEN